MLTSSTTFSGAEELAYDLQALNRATIVGERTGGGANAGKSFMVHPHLQLDVPTGAPGDWHELGGRRRSP